MGHQWSSKYPWSAPVALPQGGVGGRRDGRRRACCRRASRCQRQSGVACRQRDRTQRQVTCAPGCPAPDRTRAHLTVCPSARRTGAEARPQAGAVGQRGRRAAAADRLRSTVTPSAQPARTEGVLRRDDQRAKVGKARARRCSLGHEHASSVCVLVGMVIARQQDRGRPERSPRCLRTLRRAAARSSSQASSNASTASIATGTASVAGHRPISSRWSAARLTSSRPQPAGQQRERAARLLQRRHSRRNAAFSKPGHGHWGVSIGARSATAGPLARQKHRPAKGWAPAAIGATGRCVAPAGRRASGASVAARRAKQTSGAGIDRGHGEHLVKLQAERDQPTCASRPARRFAHQRGRAEAQVNWTARPSAG